MNKTIKRNVIVSAILAIMLCVSLIAGATFALFTSESKVNIAVTSGKVSVVANIDETSVQTKKLYDTDYSQGATNMYEGVATFGTEGLTLEKFVPGDGIKFNIVVKNESNVTVQYRTIISCENDDGLFAGLNITVGDNENYSGVTLVSDWAQLAVGSADEIVPVTIELPEGAGNDYQEKTCAISYKVEAVQGNAQVANPEDGTIYIYNANDMKALSGKYLVANNGKAEIQNVELMANVDLKGAEFKDIGVAYGDTLNFKGNGYSISNMKLATGRHNGMTNVGMFYVDSGATLNVENLKLVAPVVEDAIDAYATGAAAVVGYANGAVNLTNVDVENAKINNTFGNAAIYVGYGVNAINLTNCDIIGADSTVSGEVEDGVVRMDKTGAFVGTANTASCAVTTNNCTDATDYRDWGRVINGATWNGFVPVSTTAELLSAVKNAPVGEETKIVLTENKYDGDVAITLANLGKQGGDVEISAAEGVNPVLTGLVTLGYRVQGTGVAMYGANITFDGVTFDQAKAETHCLDVQEVKSLTLMNCKIIGDGEYGVSSARGNGTGASKIVNCTFENAGMQLLGNFATDLVIEECTFTESCINVQAGNSVTIKKCNFKKTITDANNGESFYVIRSNSTPITVESCTFKIDSKVANAAAEQEKWGVMWNRGTTNWTVSNVQITLTEAAQTQAALEIAKCTSTGAISCTGVTVNGEAYPNA